nr:MAG TPA: hypothetical protein [Caudoviricetes sp.]
MWRKDFYLFSHKKNDGKGQIITKHSPKSSFLFAYGLND